ncbi:hypothetical protein [Nonomuraea sp. B19D2]|uniref:hypothetical protein n=1 Tax=Nonomuraea sp. B19D2 TaxID=3159561 RepID=UPI0032DA2A0C
MKKITLAALVGMTMVAAPLPAQASTASADAPGLCYPALKYNEADDKVDRPAKGGNAVLGLDLEYIPKGFTYGEANTQRFKKAWEYSYRWSDDRDDVDPKHRSLWVRVVCWSGAQTVNDLKKLPVALGRFTGAKNTTIAGRERLIREGDGALGHGRMVGWVEEPGIVVTVMASKPLVKQLNKIVEGVTAP